MLHVSTLLWVVRSIGKASRIAIILWLLKLPFLVGPVMALHDVRNRLGSAAAAPPAPQQPQRVDRTQRCTEAATATATTGPSAAAATAARVSLCRAAAMRCRVLGAGCVPLQLACWWLAAQRVVRDRAFSGAQLGAGQGLGAPCMHWLLLLLQWQ